MQLGLALGTFGRLAYQLDAGIMWVGTFDVSALGLLVIGGLMWLTSPKSAALRMTSANEQELVFATTGPAADAVIARAEKLAAHSEKSSSDVD